MVDASEAEELIPLARRTVWFHAGWNRQEADLRAERAIEIVRPERARVQRPGDEFPERHEVGEARTRRIVVIRRRVVNVGGDPDNVADVAVADETEQLRNLQLAAERRAVVPVGDGLEAAAGVAHDHANRHVCRDHLPRRRRGGERVLQPRHLRASQNRRVVVQLGLGVRRVRAAIAPHVEREHFEERPAAPRSINSFRLDRMNPKRLVLEKGPLRPGCKQRDAFHRVAGVGIEPLGRIPVVADLVIVPQHDLGDIAVEALQVLVLKVVEMTPAIVHQLLCDR